MTLKTAGAAVDPQPAEIIDALRNPNAYPDYDGEIRLIETHASAVFIAGADVYKLKKPVDFGFLNYATPQRRRLMCHLEVQANAQLAPGIYHGVVELVRTATGLQVGGDGETVDYLVHMRRLPENATLSSRVERDAAGPAEIDRIAHRIATFHLQSPRSPEIDRSGLPAAIQRNVEENFEQTEQYIGSVIPRPSYNRIADAARRFLSDRRGMLHARVRDGLIRDGHGDIRAEHVYMLDDVRVIDRIEFNNRIRYGDVAADLGFLAMDLDAMNRPDLSDRLVGTYIDRSGLDIEPVLDFYRSYRAYVRGKVTAFRLDQSMPVDEEAIHLEARRFFHLAHRYAVGDRGPRLVIMSGLTGTGKSTLARRIAAAQPASLIDSDTVRKHLAGLNPQSRQRVAFGSGIYSDEMTGQVYRELLDQAASGLRRGQTIILDATYTSRKHRQAARELARKENAAFLVVECIAPEDVTRARLASRETEPDQASDGRWEIYLAQRAAADPLSPSERSSTATVDTSEPAMTQVEAVLGVLEKE